MSAFQGRLVHNLSLLQNLLPLSCHMKKAVMGTAETSVFVLVVNLLSFYIVYIDSVVIMDQLFSSNHNFNMLDHGLTTQQLFSSQIPAM